MYKVDCVNMCVLMCYLVQMMAIATNETIHTPPTKEPAIRESCCPSSDLYSSAETHTHSEKRGIISLVFETLQYTQLSISGGGEYKPDSFSLPNKHKISFARLILHDCKHTPMHARKHTHTHTHTHKVGQNLITSQPYFHSCSTS